MEASRSTIAPAFLQPQLAPIGYIKLGGKRPDKTTGSEGGEFQPPVKFNHFKIRTRDRGQDGNLLPDTAVHDIVGPEPRELLVRLPFDTREQNFRAKMTQYSGQTEVRECNGLTAIVKSSRVEETCMRAKGQACSCKPYGRLAVMLEACPTVGGVYLFRTTSWESVNSLQTALGIFQQQFGSLRGLPLKFVCYPAEVRYQQGGKTKTGTAYKAALLLRASFEEAQHAALEYHRVNQIARREILQLARGTAAALDELDRVEAGEIGEEFFPAGAGATKQIAAGTSKLADINREITQGTAPAPAAPTAPADPEPSDGEPTAADVRKLLDEVKTRLTDSAISRIEVAIKEAVPETLRAAADWLEQVKREAGGEA